VGRKRKAQHDLESHTTIGSAFSPFTVLPPGSRENERSNGLGMNKLHVIDNKINWSLK
jgi:hypothetical protein